MVRPLKPKNRQLGVLIVILVVAVGFMFMLRQCSMRRSTAVVDEKPGGDTINVAIDYSPTSMYMRGDTLGGFSYDVVRQIASANGLCLKFHPIVSLNTAIERLDNGMYDLVIADLPATVDYKNRYLFTEPVYFDRQVLVQRRDAIDPVNSQLDLGGRTVTVVAGSPIVTRIANLSAEIGDTIYVREDSLYGAEQLVMLTAVGEVPLAVVNEGVAREVTKDNDSIDISTNVSFTQFQSWMTSRQRRELRDTLDVMIKRYKSTPAYRTLLDRYGLSGR